MPTPYKLLTIFAALAIAGIFAATAPLRAAELPKTIIIIDGSGSMWGRIDGREKIVLARNAIASKLPRLAERTELGVMSYGHRRRRDCRDVQVLLPVGPIEQKTYGKVIKRLLPRGKTPTAFAMQQAVQALGPAIEGQRARIVLLADGAENCRQDPCETARQIVEQRPDISIDVIAFGVPTKDLPRVRCIAKNGGGVFHFASDNAQLETALDKVIANLGTKQKAEPPVEKISKPKVIPGLYLGASLSQSGPLLDEGVSWRIYKKGEGSKNGAVPLQRDTTASPHLKLPAGDYHVEARYGPLQLARDISLGKADAIKQRFSFNAAVLRGKASLGADATGQEEVVMTLYNTASGPPGPNNIISHKQEREAEFYLPPGKYTLKARLGEAEAAREIRLKAGNTVSPVLRLQAGHVALSSRLDAESEPLEEVQYAIFRRQPDTTYREVLRTLNPRPQLVLPAGDYLVVAQRDAASNSATLQLAAGERRQLQIGLKAGRLNLSSSLAAGEGAAGAGIAYTLRSQSTRQRKVIRLANGRAQRLDRPLPVRSSRNRFILPAGRYEIRALVGSSNAEARSKIDIEAGKTADVRLDVPAGRVRLTLRRSQQEQALPGVFWSVFNNKGKQVASASRATPSITLQEGRYKVVADYYGNSYKRDFTIANRDDKQVVLKIE